MALNELKIQHELVESLQIDPQSEAYIKNPDLLRHNPAGLVPTIVQTDSNGSVSVCCDSLKILQELFNLDEEDDSVQEAGDWNRRICSIFYQVLVRQDASESEAAWQIMKQELETFSKDLSPFYKGASSPGVVDFAIFPFVHRLYILEHYKGKSCCYSELEAWGKEWNLDLRLNLQYIGFQKGSHLNLSALCGRNGEIQSGRIGAKGKRSARHLKVQISDLLGRCNFCNGR